MSTDAFPGSDLGFLGTGTILKIEHKIIGLATAATLWVAASVGVAAGAGFYRFCIMAIVATALASLALLLAKVEK